MIKIISVGKIKDKSLVNLIKTYLERIEYFTSIKIIEVDDEPIKNNMSHDQIKDIEATRILRHINDDEFVYLLDLNGKDYDSIFMANHLEKTISSRTSKIVFVIGGSLGLGKSILDRSNFRWKLSSCTFPHQLVRLLLLEQIYRFYTINKNITYHK